MNIVESGHNLESLMQIYIKCREVPPRKTIPLCWKVVLTVSENQKPLYVEGYALIFLTRPYLWSQRREGIYEASFSSLEDLSTCLSKWFYQASKSGPSLVCYFSLSDIYTI